MAIFLDANYLIALFDEDDVHHDNAVKVRTAIDKGDYGAAFTSDDVVDEAISVSLRKFGNLAAKQIAQDITKSVIIIIKDRHIFDNALKLFLETKYNFSFTDCVIQSVITTTNTECIATFDKEFKKTSVKVVD